MSADLGITFTSYNEWAKQYLNHSKVHREYSFYRLGFFSAPLYENLVYFTKLIQWKQSPPLKLLLRLSVPWHHLVYSAVPLTFFALSGQGQVNDQSLRKADRLLSLFGGQEIKVEDPQEKWRRVRGRLIKLWSYVCCGVPPAQHIADI
jgi:hypothetical protein